MLFQGKKVTIDTDSQKIEEILSRGVSQVVDEERLREKLHSGRQLRIKLGVDPTSPHIHLGRATQLLKLRDFQKLGHHIIFIVGDATGVIGDTSDKESERPMLSKEEVDRNAKKYFAQAEAILDMHTVEKVYNSKWLDKLTFAEIGKQANAFSVADFIARENIKKRLNEGKRVSLRETLYPLMQGYDSVVVRADVEIGGTDQWFNLLAGRALQEVYGQEPQSVMTNMLISGLDGRKMSSSWGNTIVLDTAPNDMYGQVMSLNDDLVKEYFVTCTRVSLGEIDTIMSKDPKDAKMRLAYEVVKLLHNETDAKNAQDAFENTFTKGGVPEDILRVEAVKTKPLVEILIETKLIDSKNELRRLIKESAVTNMTTGEKVTDMDQTFSSATQIKIGKRRFISIDVL